MARLRATCASPRSSATRARCYFDKHASVLYLVEFGSQGMAFWPVTENIIKATKAPRIVLKGESRTNRNRPARTAAMAAV